MAIADIETEELADFETALADPSAYFADPESILADAELTLEQKRRFLTEWEQDVADRQQAAGEGMGSAEELDNVESELLRRIHKSLEQLNGQTEDRPAGKSFWRRLLPL
ncbi:hypothetical protein FJQ54_03745 [Sandaracinobacter neustonicus]|uniref:Uncharacterized protein n=1 Tax=Sandaracinobacter neustonicus TaxID=1715348 RepID=A0A501XT56_9SPHN|nr:hypothetical protein [Sandaracinobacter neustonicus]TPE63962.1 hypothetical protein FJQ54_03745 [Sandaracinobacter neustonicus]